LDSLFWIRYVFFCEKIKSLLFENFTMNQQLALFIVNHHARQGQKQAEAAARQLQTLGLDLILQKPNNPTELAQVVHFYRDQVDRVIIGGGDGTLNTAIASLVETGLPLGILPLGTANDLARTLGIPANLDDACKVIAAGKTQPIDLGQVNDKYFLNVASLGLGVEITRNLTKEAKRRWGGLAYLLTALKTLLRTRAFRADISYGEKTHIVKTVQIAIGNGRFYGGGMAVAADARIDDQRLDIYSIGIKYWWQLLTILPALYRGRHQAIRWSDTWQGKEIHISTRRPRPINTDGEITTFTPARFRVIPKALQVYVP
jgi:diacylglycerol kinase (ATP)